MGRLKFIPQKKFIPKWWEYQLLILGNILNDTVKCLIDKDIVSTEF